MDAIHFGLIPGRKLTTQGDADWRGMSILFTLDQTAVLEQQGNEFLYRYQTDQAGMEHAFTLGKSASDALGAAIDVIGKLIQHADMDEIHAGDRALIGLLISGLGELSAQVTDASFAIADALVKGNYLQDLDKGDAHAK